MEYLHPDAEEILGETYGLMIYQESMMRIAQRFAGYTLAEADNLRKACGKKIRELIAKEREKFVAGCDTTGYGRELGTRWFDIIEPFADYAFNKSHSYGYGYVAYQTAYLKANFPVEYLSALLTSVKANLDKAAIYLNECRTLGIKVCVPDVNRSESDFGPDGEGNILFGLSAVRNVGEGLVELIVTERNSNGPFADFYDFAQRVDEKVLNKRTIESLIKAGGFDSLGHPRQGLLTSFEQIIDQTVARRREHEMGVQTLFGALDDGGGPLFDERTPIPDIELAKRPRLAFEKEMLGLYVSDHPLMGYERTLQRKTDCALADLAEKEDQSRVIIGGVVTNLVRKWTKKGELMAVFTLEDLASQIEAMVFPEDDGPVRASARRADQRSGRSGRRPGRSPRRPAETDRGIGGDPRHGRVHRERHHCVCGCRRTASITRCSASCAPHWWATPATHRCSSTCLMPPSACPTTSVLDTSNGLVGELRELLGEDSVAVWTTRAAVRLASRRP